MSTFIVLLGMAGLLGLLVWWLIVTPPTRIVAALRFAGPIVLALAGGGLIAIGRFGLGAPALFLAYALYMRSRRAAGVQRTPGQRSTVRSAMLEMILDHDTGDIEGIVLAGTYEGRELASLSDSELMDLARQVRKDADSAQLLEAYLDRRMPGWRDNAQADDGARHRAASDAGAMTEQEAYDILGLETGASAVDIRKAHRSLMQRVHPDLGGSSFLAQRINEAKDFLLRIHDERS